MLNKYHPFFIKGTHMVMPINQKAVFEILSLKVDKLKKAGIKKINLYPQLVDTKKTEI